MIWVNSINNAIYTILSSDSVLVSSSVNVELNELYNLDPNKAPWIGIYNNNFTIEPRRVQVNLPWQTEFNFSVHVQEIRYDTDTLGGEKVNELLTHTLTAINSNRTLLDTVAMIKGFEITPFQLDIEQENDLWAYEININAERLT